MKKKYTKDILLNYINNYINEYKKIPTAKDIDNNKEYFPCCSRTYYEFFGGIKNAINECNNAIKDNILKEKDIVGKTFGELKVISFDHYEKDNKNHNLPYYKCKCLHCGKDKIISKYFLGRQETCGCLQSETIRNIRKKYNIYDLSGEYGIGYTSNTNKPFYFDLEDYDKIKNYCWRESKGNRVRTYLYYEIINKKRKQIEYDLHRIILDYDVKINVVDHINRNPMDNRKINLRITTNVKNSYNRSVPTNNTSGIIGVMWDKSRNKWISSIIKNNKKIYLGRYISKEEALIARLKAELKYFGKDFAPQRHLFEKYGIGEDINEN